MPKTEAERKAGREAAAQRREAEKLRFPDANILHRGAKGSVILRLKAGEQFWMKVMKKGTWSKSDLHNEWEETSLFLNDPDDLATLIRALTGRYNALVDEINAKVKGVSMQKIERVELES